MNYVFATRPFYHPFLITTYSLIILIWKPFMIPTISLLFVDGHLKAVYLPLSTGSKPEGTSHHYCKIVNWNIKYKQNSLIYKRYLTIMFQW